MATCFWDFFSLSWLLYWLNWLCSPCLSTTALYRDCFKRRDWYSSKCLLKLLPTVIWLCGPSCFSPTIPFLSKSLKNSFPVVCIIYSVYVHVHLCAHTWVHPEARGGRWVSSATVLHNTPLSQDLSLNLELALQLGLPLSSQDPSVPWSRMLGLQACAITPDFFYIKRVTLIYLLLISYT